MLLIKNKFDTNLAITIIFKLIKIEELIFHQIVWRFNILLFV